MARKEVKEMMPPKFCRDYEILHREPLTVRGFFSKVLLRGSVLMMFFGRLGEQTGFVGRLARFIYLLMSRRRGIEFNYSAIRGGGIVFAHAYSITVNDDANIEGDVILFKGCTIGGIGSGRRQGVPRLGRNVVVGANAAIVGGVSIGDDVFIAANAFVNFDVPPHSVVIGNPGVIHHKEFATRDCFQSVWEQLNDSRA